MRDGVDMRLKEEVGGRKVVEGWIDDRSGDDLGRSVLRACVR